MRLEPRTHTPAWIWLARLQVGALRRRLRDDGAQAHREIHQQAVARVVRYSKMPARTLKRRFKLAAGVALIDYVQNLRIEEAKRLLESTDLAADEISAKVGYEDASFFRRLFKRRTGLPPSQYRRAFSSATMP